MPPLRNFPYSLRNQTIDSLDQIRFGLEQRLASLSAQFGPNWPEVVQVKQELEKVASQVDEERRLSIQRSRTDYKTAQKRHNMLQATLNQEKHLATDLHESSIQYNILKREVDSSSQLYEGLLQRLKEAGVSAGLKSSNIRVVDPGEMPRLPYHPRTQRNLILGLLLGLFCGVGLAYLLDQLDNTVKTSEDVEREIGLPSLGMVPAFAGNGVKSKLALIRRADEHGPPPCPLGGDGSPLQNVGSLPGFEHVHPLIPFRPRSPGGAGDFGITQRRQVHYGHQHGRGPGSDGSPHPAGGS